MCLDEPMELGWAETRCRLETTIWYRQRICSHTACDKKMIPVHQIPPMYAKKPLNHPAKVRSRRGSEGVRSGAA